MGLGESIGNFFAGVHTGEGGGTQTPAPSSDSQVASTPPPQDTPAVSTSATSPAQTGFTLGSGVPNIMPHGAPAATEPAATPPDPAPSSSPPSVRQNGQADFARAAGQLKARDDNTRAQAALVLGSQGQSDGPPVSDSVLAGYFNTTLPVVQANREPFQSRYAIERGREALADTTVLPGLIVQDPELAFLLRGQVAPLATMERTLSHETSAGDFLYEAVKGFAGFSNDLLKVGSLAVASPLMAVDGLASLLTGKEDTSLQDTWFKYTTQKLDENQSYFEHDPATGFGGKLAHGAGGVLGMVPYMYLTGGAGGTGGVTARMAQSARAMAVPGATEGVNTANDVYATTGSAGDATKAGAVRAATTVAQGMIPLSLPGIMVKRVVTALPIGVASGEASRLLNNAVLPENMQQPFNAEDAGANAVVSSIMAGLPSLHQQAVSAAANFERLKTMSKAAQDAKIRTENPEVFSQLVQRMAAGSDLKDLHVTGKALAQAMDEHGVTLDQLGASLPDVARQLPEAIRQQGEVVMPVRDYLTREMGSDSINVVHRNGVRLD